MSNKTIKNRPVNSNRITIDDGSRVYDIVNKRGELLGQFPFVPSDIGIIDRYKHTIQVFDELQTSINDKSDETAITEMSEKMKKEIDYLFNADVSGTFFKITGPFSILGSGEFFVENVIRAVQGVIETETGTRLERTKSRASKYTERYHK